MRSSRLKRSLAVMVVSLTVNGTVRSVTADLDTPLLYVLRNDLGLNAAKFGCGLGQCGYCTAGMIMMGKAILDRNPRPSEADMRLGLVGNFCRCGTHNRIVRAILKAAQAMGRS